MRYVQVRLRYPPEERHPMHALVDRSDVVDRSEMWHWNVDDEAAFVALFRVYGERGPYEPALAAVDSVVEYDLVEADEESFYLYVVEEPVPGSVALYEAFASTSLVALPPLVFGPDGALTFGMVGDASEVQQALDALPDAMETDVQRLSHFDGTHPLGATVTARQREVLRSAHEMGYYEVPAKTTVEAIAEAMDIAPSTVSNHLGKAESALVSAFLDE
ncbi:helix-turn-helix domain-containing protein [Haloarchaeobius sp. DFWS5]|uniref:helix-turn-helix domain-containing protein n=1 Tax=Haloarchaeobius sp. DFWS5 TaxID=3446114 RepID=UPI003EBE8BC8